MVTKVILHSLHYDSLSIRRATKVEKLGMNVDSIHP